ncbi:MAG: type II toxin-antitoxin system RelE/ParE family toxin [Bacteroidales bacterium]|nr:type II toxin-antitoxin system RelE/ParE family toxin [Bacteroidales bacterium]
MSYTLHWHEKAKEDLIGIARLVAWRFSKTVAERMVSRIRDDANLLRDNPFLGAKSPVQRPDGVVCRELVSKKNRIVYIVIDDRIDILAVFDTRRNPEETYKSIKTETHKTIKT